MAPVPGGPAGDQSAIFRVPTSRSYLGLRLVSLQSELIKLGRAGPKGSFHLVSYVTDKMARLEDTSADAVAARRGNAAPWGCEHKAVFCAQFTLYCFSIRWHVSSPVPFSYQDETFRTHFHFLLLLLYSKPLGS